MPVIYLDTIIKADIETCFDLATSIDLHCLSTSGTNEKAIKGTTSGLIKLNETVTWEATHFYIRQQLTSVISAYNRPFHFRDEQVKGAFNSMVHDHDFEQKDGYVLMTDSFCFTSPYGIAGRVFNSIILKRYLTKFLRNRNNMIKEFAENNINYSQLIRPTK